MVSHVYSRANTLWQVSALAIALAACNGSGAHGDGTASGTVSETGSTGVASAGPTAGETTDPSDSGSTDGTTASAGGSSSDDSASDGTQTGDDSAGTDTGGTDSGQTGTTGGDTEGIGDTGDDPWNEGDPDDPFAFASCEGEPLTAADALSLMAPGGTTAELGAYRVFLRSRDCNEQTGCTPWSQPQPHHVGSRVDNGPLFGGDYRPPVGETRVSINPKTADVELQFGNQNWCTQTIDGELESPCDIEPVLLPPAGDGSWTIDPGLLRRNCFMFRAHGTEPIDNSVNEREFDVVIRGDHAIDRADVSNDLLQLVASQPESLMCWGHTHNPASCSPHFDTYQTRMWDLSATFNPGVGDGMGTIDIDVPQFDLVSGTVELDEYGYGIFSAPTGANGIRAVHVSLGEGVLIVQSFYAPNFQNTCVAGQDWSCAGVYATGI